MPKWIRNNLKYHRGFVAVAFAEQKKGWFSTVRKKNINKELDAVGWQDYKWEEVTRTPYEDYFRECWYQTPKEKKKLLEELEEYKNKLRDFPVNFIISNNSSINEQRNFIVKHYAVGQYVMGLDDDIQSIETKINDKKTEPLLQLKELGHQAFDLCLKNKFNLWGINASFNPFFIHLENSNACSLKPCPL